MNYFISAGAAGLALAAGLLLVREIDSSGAFYQASVRRMEDLAYIVGEQRPIDTFLAMHPLKDLSTGYPPPEVKDGKTLVTGVPIINQFPELPVGCEITSATVLLQYLGYDVDKMTMERDYLPKDNNFFYDKSGVRWGPDPNKAFVGNPKDHGLGCLAPVIANSIDSYLKAQGSQGYAVQLQNADQATLETLLDNGVPIQVWASREMMSFRYTPNNQWTISGSGQNYVWPANSHSLVLIGYDANNYYFSDCDNKPQITPYEKSEFLAKWNQFGRQGIVIKRA